MSDPEFDPDFVEAFNNADDDELAAQDAEHCSTTGASGCFSTVLSLGLLVMAVLAFSIS